jgi:hypothetical protein
MNDIDQERARKLQAMEDDRRLPELLKQKVIETEPVPVSPLLRRPEVTIAQFQAVQILYTNWKGDRRWRLIRPYDIAYCASQWHPKAQWVIMAIDLEEEAGEVGSRQRFKQFPLASIEQWVPVESSKPEQKPAYDLDEMNKDGK